MHTFTPDTKTWINDHVYVQTLDTTIRVGFSWSMEGVQFDTMEQAHAFAAQPIEVIKALLA